VGWLRRALAPTVAGLPPTFWWLWAGTLVNRVGAFVLPFLAFYLTDELDLTPAFVGLVLATFGFGSIVATLLGGSLSDRLGRRPVLLFSQVSTAATLVVLGLTTTPVAVLVLCGVLGLTSNTARPAFSAMMTDIVPADDRVRAFSLNYWAINLGFAIAPVLGGLLAKSGYLSLFLVDAATTLVFAVLVFLRVPESHPTLGAPRSSTAGSLVDVLRDRVFLSFVLLTFGFAVVFMQHLSSLPVQMGDDGLTPAQYGTIIALNGALIVIVTVPLTSSSWAGHRRGPVASCAAWPLSGCVRLLLRGGRAGRPTRRRHGLRPTRWSRVVDGLCGPLLRHRGRPPGGRAGPLASARRAAGDGGSGGAAAE
jgi:MFS family permease